MRERTATGRVPQMQVEKMKAARGLGLDLSFAEDERPLDVAKRSGQQPRVFYRRELTAHPLVVAKTAAAQPKQVRLRPGGGGPARLL